MFGYISSLDKSMNGIKTLSDGISVITDGNASHENITFNNYVKADNGLTSILNNSITTGTLNADNANIYNDLTTNNLDAINIDCDYFSVNNVNDSLNKTCIIDGNTNTITNNGSSTFNNSISIINKNISQTQSGTIQQTGTGTNNFKDTNINGFLVVGSNFTQNGGSCSIKDVTTDNITMRTDKSITQIGSSISNTFGTTSITNLVCTNSISLPSNVTIPGSTVTDDIIMNEDSVIFQDITYTTSKFNKFRYSKFLDIDIDGNINQIKGGATCILKNTTIEGTIQVQGDITQTTGATILKTINCDNLTLTTNSNINQSGTGTITQSGTGTNNMKQITLLSNNDLIQSGTGRITQNVSGVNNLSHTNLNGYTILRGRNNGTSGETQNIPNNSGLHLQNQRIDNDGYSYLMNHKGSSASNGGFKFQRYNNSGVYIDNPLTIGDIININKNVDIVGSLSSSTLGLIGSVDNTEFQKLNGLTIGGTIQDKFNSLDSSITSLATTSTNNNIALSGISYNSSNDTTTIDNNLIISSSKTFNINNILFNSNTLSMPSNYYFRIGSGLSSSDKRIAFFNILETGHSYIDYGTGSLYFRTGVGSQNVMELTNSYGINIYQNPLVLNPCVLTERSNRLATMNYVRNITDNLELVTRGQTYNSTSDITTFDNNLTINKELVVQGMNLRNEIISLETSFTTGTINSTNLISTNISTSNLNVNGNANITGSLTVGDLSIKYGYRGLTVNSDYSTIDIGTTKTLFIWDNLEISNDCKINGTLTGPSISAPTISNYMNLASSSSTGFYMDWNYTNSTIDFDVRLAIGNTNNNVGKGILVCAGNYEITENLIIDNCLETHSNLIRYVNNSKTLGIVNVLVAEIKVSSRFNNKISVNSPVSLYRKYKNITVDMNLFNRFYDTINYINYGILKNDVVFASGTCVYNNTLPNAQIYMLSGSSTSSRSYEIYITNALCEFIPDSTTNEDVYKVIFTIGHTSDTSWQSFNLNMEEFGFYVNTNIATKNVTLQTGTNGNNYSSFSYSTSENIVYCSNKSSTVLNDLVSNDIFNQNKITTNNIQTSSLTTNNIITPQILNYGAVFYDCPISELNLNKSNYIVRCSLKNALRNDDAWLIMPRYKIIFYSSNNYINQIAVYDNTNNNDMIVITSVDLYGSANNVGSLKLYYNNNEIVLPYFS